MKVNNQNTICSTKTNFKANKIATVQRFIEKDTLFEKVDVFRLRGSQDLPFAKKIIAFMETQKKHLKESHQKLLEQLKEFVENPNDKRTYIGIKNDEEIVGCMQIDKSNSSWRGYGYKAPKIRAINITSDENIAREAIRYSALTDTEVVSSKENLADSAQLLDLHHMSTRFAGTCHNECFGRYRKEITSRNPEYTFRHVNQGEKHNLEEILDI